MRLRDRVDVRDPRRLGLVRWLRWSRAARVEVRDAVGDPVHVLLDGHDHVGERRGAARPGDVEQVREARDRQAQVVQRPGAPFVLDAQAAAAAQVQPHQRAGHRVEAGGQHQRVEVDTRGRRSSGPAGVIASIGCSLTSTSRTFGRL